MNGDRLPESHETFFVNLTGPVNATIADAQGVGTILNDELWLTALVLAGGDVRLNFFTESNKTYRVERTDNLIAPIIWVPVPGATNVTGTGNAVEVSDVGAANQPQQFYRVTLLP